jgi:mannose/fructose-specific phosphotransferase system component IIA
MSETERALGVLVGHGAMAEGLVDAAQRITGGIADCLAALSNDGKSPDQLRSELDSMVGDSRCIVFVDLQSGSCGMAAVACCRDSVRRVVVSGVNLPMLLHFVFSRELAFEQLVPRLLERGRASIVAIPAIE